MKPDFQNTSEIASSTSEPAREYAADDQEIDFTPEQHAIWADLFAGVYQPRFIPYLCKELKIGLALMDFDPAHIPTVSHLNAQIYPRTGWTVERTAVRYTDADNWYEKFAQRVFLITDYLRTREQLEFTPEPDMFHDIFGHLPYLTQQFYADIEDRFAPAYQKAAPDERDVIKRLAWYSTEFGLVMEDGEMKAFGAGLISGRGELAKVIAEIERLDRDVFGGNGAVYDRLSDLFWTNEPQVDRLIAEINRLHQQGQMSSAEQGWVVVNQIYEKLGISRGGYFGGEVLLAPFNLKTIAKVPKTVYAMNPIFFVASSFADMDAILDSYLTPIGSRP